MPAGPAHSHVTVARHAGYHARLLIMRSGRDIAIDLRAAVAEGLRLTASVPEWRTATRPPGGGWCAREAIGHLIDSACNNHRRFVVNQTAERLIVEPYEQSEWASRQRYAECPLSELTVLWAAYNRHLANVIEAIPHDVLSLGRGPAAAVGFGYVTLEETDASIAALAEDYVGHQRHHLAQVRRLLQPSAEIPLVVDEALVEARLAARPERKELRGVRFDLRPLDVARDEGVAGHVCSL